MRDHRVERGGDLGSIEGGVDMKGGRGGEGVWGMMGVWRGNWK